PSIRAAALTDIGRVRQRNEDRFVLDLPTMVFGVADGVGGLPGGADAAQCCADEVVAGVAKHAKDENIDLVALVHHVNLTVHNLGIKLSPSMGIGSTLTFGYVRGNNLRIAHVGDSRCYGLRADRL